ncbi:F-box protein At4g22280 [Quercus suber]|uniref:F-box protein At4g22280 n=1 Tax=Quercus suber TaxID=58331 RepID=UPI0032DEA1EC
MAAAIFLVDVVVVAEVVEDDDDDVSLCLNRKLIRATSMKGQKRESMEEEKEEERKSERQRRERAERAERRDVLRARPCGCGGSSSNSLSSSADDYKDIISSLPDYTDYPGPTRTNSNFSFLDAVSIIWALRNAIPLRKLCLHWTSNCDSFLVSTWVQDTLLHGGLQELNLYIFTGTNPPLEMSTTLFFSSTLVSLRLRGAILLNPPPASASTFPSLRTLALGDVGYAKHDSISTLLAACPVLQDLSLIVSTSNFDGLGESADKVNVIVLVPTLKTLHIQWPAYDCWLYKLQINTPALEWFHFEGGLGEDVVLESLPNLVEAVIELEDEDSNSVDYAKRVLDFSRPLLNVQSLKLSIEYAEVFCNPYKYGIPMFHNLSSLMFYGELRPHWYAWDVVQLMLCQAPKLQILALN